jgi:hypothetical protein
MIPTPPKKCSAKSWVMQLSKEIVVMSDKESTINFRAIMEKKVTSKRDKKVRKKYIGESQTLTCDHGYHNE